jgi:hypothetical protein
MKYATWILDFSDPKYGTGPEQSVYEQGENAQGAMPEGDITAGAKILGYFTGELTGLEVWSFTEVTQDEALAFAVTINSTAYFAEDGTIQFEQVEEI